VFLRLDGSFPAVLYPSTTLAGYTYYNAVVISFTEQSFNIHKYILFYFCVQYRRGKGTFREATTEQSEKIQFLSFRDRTVRQVSAAN